MFNGNEILLPHIIAERIIIIFILYSEICGTPTLTYSFLHFGLKLVETASSPEIASQSRLLAFR